jgi:DNA-binding NtrC family response regulator
MRSQTDDAAKPPQHFPPCCRFASISFSVAETRRRTVDRFLDIPSLVRYFVQTFARRMNKRIATVPTETMNVLMKSDWPGNVTELEGFIERAVILTEGSTLHAPLTEL